MAIEVNARDIKLLTTIAEHRLLTISQLAAFQAKNVRALRRRLHELKEQEIVRVDSQVFGRQRGRPEGVVSLDETGVRLLKTQGILSADIAADRVTRQGVRCIEHHLLLNDLRVQVAGIGVVVPSVSCRFLSPVSPFMERSTGGRTLVQERFRAPGSDGWTELVPDGVFSLTHAELGKTLLFFVEGLNGLDARATVQCVIFILCG